MYVQRNSAGEIIALFANLQTGFAEEFVEGAAIHTRPDKILSDKVAAVQRHVDDTAKAYGYDNIYTAVSYADEPAVPRFQIEGRALRAWRSLVWARCHEVMSEIEVGERPIPSDEELLLLLPIFTMPS